MRQVLLVVSILMLGLTWSFAQTSGSSETTPNGSSSGSSQSMGTHSGTSGEMGQSSASGHVTVEGCLNGSNGNYTLTDKRGNTYQLTGDTAKLSEHVRHEVKITGSSSAAGASTSGSTTSGGMESSGSQHTLQVTSVKHVSKSCQAGGAMSH
jgi:hypothetical protein